MRKLAEKAESLSEASGGAAFLAFFTYAVDQAAGQSAYADALSEAAGAAGGEQAVSRVGTELAEALGTLLTRAQDAGAIRTDIGVPELIALLIGSARAAERIGPDVRARALAILLAPGSPEGAARSREPRPPEAIFQ